MIMPDQDYDGSHIKGLVINFIHNFWPELVHMNGFPRELATPSSRQVEAMKCNLFSPSMTSNNGHTTKTLRNRRSNIIKGWE